MDTGGITRENLPRKLTLEFIKKITGKLSQPQPIGGVYEVNLDDDSKITVKKLAENAPVPRDIVFDKIIDLKHENIVKMIAYCPKAETRLEQSNERSTMADVTENILCYEYLPADNLEDILRGGSSILKHWDMRFKIIKGICKGIYSIQTLGNPIVHLDLKPQNILLDKNMMVPEISNFGFAKMFEQNETKMKATNAMGSVGYMAPEYLYDDEISASSDIYSLGLVILEIATGEKNNSSTDQKHARNYIDKVRENWTEGQILSTYPELGENELNQVEDCIEIGLQCVEIDQKKRPSIDKILQTLNVE